MLDSSLPAKDLIRSTSKNEIIIPKKEIQYHPVVENLPISATLRINESINDMKQQNIEVYHFGFGGSPFSPPQAMIDEMINYAHRSEYLPTQGLNRLREALVSYHERVDNIIFDKDNILIGPGTKSLLFTLQMAQLGDLILPSPSWVSYFPQGLFFNKKVHFLNTSFNTNWKITAETLETCCLEIVSDSSYNSPPVLLLNTPNNPTGHIYTSNELQEITLIARKYDIIILSDEIYGCVDYSADHVSIASIYPEKTIVSTGISKYFCAGGWRLGSFAFPPQLKKLMNVMKAIASESWSSVCTPVQFAAVVGFEDLDGSCFEHVAITKKILKAIGIYCSSALRNIGINVIDPDGSFYIFPDASNYVTSDGRLLSDLFPTSELLCTKILKESKVGILPGSSFLRPPAELTFRLAFVDFDGDFAFNGLKDVEIITNEHLEEFCPNIINGMDNLVQWFQAL